MILQQIPPTPLRALLRLALAAAALAAAAVLAQATPPVATLLAAQSEIAFTTRQMGVPVEGRFGKFAAQIALDPKNPQTGSVAITVDVGSARFGAPELDAELGKPGWLAAGRFPQATFQSSAIKATAPGRFEVAGALSIKGTTREIVVPVQVAQSGASVVASGSFTVQRLDYNVGEGEWADTSLLANPVVVRFKLGLGGLPAL